MKRSNCFVYAIRQFVTPGGYLVVRRSQFGPWPHVLWSPDLRTFSEFVPPRYRPPYWFPPLWFRGTVRTKETQAL